MVEHQIHFGRKFYQDKHKGYWYSTDRPRIYAHRWVWINHYGKIPSGYQIHHRDEDKSNNNIENLELLSMTAHFRLHGLQPKNRERAKLMADKYRHMTKEWHASEEGLAWHKAHGILLWSQRKPFEITCKVCNKKTMTKSYHQEVCSNNCKSKWRRDQGMDDIEKKCLRCEKTFVDNKYSRQKYCGKGCLKIIRKELVGKAVELRKKGLTYAEIGKILGMPREQVCPLIKKHSSEILPFRAKKIPLLQ